ncbi:MAG: hypothetical protein HY399_04045 [Elusimicrobia bacterium]|nr:hypothetical protein [Elusimicrobiota bacterium]
MSTNFGFWILDFGLGKDKYPKLRTSHLELRTGVGFTLVELAVATIIFGMFMLSLIAVYSTFLRQSGGIQQGDARLRAMGSVAARALQQEVSLATLITQPAGGGSDRVLRGWRNLGSDGTNINTSLDSGATPTRWFYFCVTNIAGGASDVCPAGQAQECLWYYGGPLVGPPTTVTPAPANCGAVLAGTDQFRFLASGISVPGTGVTAPVPGCPVGPAPMPTSCFTRNPAEYAKEWNAIRVRFDLVQPLTDMLPGSMFPVDTTFNAHISNGM